MLTYGLPAAYALFIWWLSTGLVLYIVSRPSRTHAVSMVIMTGLAAAALYSLTWIADDTSLTAAFIAFTSALVIWGWHEMSFLTGFVTGPRTTACPGRPAEPAATRAPLWFAIQAVLYHELAIAATAAAIFALTWGSANTIGLWTFIVLWLMRLSAKLNVYLGVQNLTEQFLPQNLKYLTTYFCRKPMNGLFPLVVTAATAVTVLLFSAALSSTASPFEAAGLMFLATLMALAVLEHWFLVLPIPADQLWAWGLASRVPEPLSEPVRPDSMSMATA